MTGHFKANKPLGKGLRKIRDGYCIGDFYMQRGLGLLTSPYTIIKYTAFAVIIIEAINKFFHTDLWGILTVQNAMYFAPVLAILCLLIGLADVKKIHLIQRTNEISTRLNPILYKMERRIKRLDKRTRDRKTYHNCN